MLVLHSLFKPTRVVRINRILSVCAILLGSYLALTPLLPYISYYSSTLFGTHDTVTVTQKITPRVAQALISSERIPTDNRLQIASIGVDGTIFEGTSIVTLAKGIWHRAHTSTPDKGGNTVFVAHRFLYRSGPNTFFLLDKVKLDEQIIVWWQGVKYVYRVAEIREAEPIEVEVEQATTDTRLTLYTCTPLFSPTKRLVVVAFPERM